MAIRKTLTKMSDAKMYNPNVANNEMTILRKMEFENRSETVNGPLE